MMPFVIKQTLQLGHITSLGNKELQMKMTCTYKMFMLLLHLISTSKC